MALLKEIKITEMKQWIRRYAWVFILDFFSKSFGYLLLPFYLTYMTQQQFGVFTYLFYIITAAANVLNLGFTTSTGKLFNEYESDRGSYLFSINIFLFSVIGLIFAICLVTGLDIYLVNNLVKEKNFSYHNYRLGFLLYIAYLVLYGQISVFFQFTNQIKKFQWINLARIVVMNIVAIMLFKMTLSSQSASIRINIEVILSWLIFLPLTYTYIKQFKVKYNWSSVRRSLMIGIPIILASLASLVYTVSDKYFLQQNESLEVLAIYNLALFLTTPLSFLLTTFNLVWLPKFFNEKSLLINFKRTKFICLALGSLFIVGSCVIGIVVYMLVYFKGFPASYSLALTLFPFIVISVMVDGFYQLLNNFVVVLERTWFTLSLTLLTGLFMFLLSRWLIPIYGIKGTVFILICLSIFRFVSLMAYIKNQIKNQNNRLITY